MAERMHPEDTSMLDVLDEALESAHWITDADQATVELARRLAAVLDDPDFPEINGRFDNVSQTLFLRTCASLGLTPEMRAAWDKKSGDKSDGAKALAGFRKASTGLRAV